MLEKWMKLSIPLPGVTSVNPSVVRRRLAAQSDAAPASQQVHCSVFNYGDRGPLDKRPAIRFCGGKQFNVVACGDAGVELLRQEGNKIVDLLALTYHSDFLSEQRTLGKYEVSINDRLLTYCVPMMIIQRHPKEHKALVKMTPAERVTFVDERIRKDFAEALNAVGSEIDLDHPQVLLGDTTISGVVVPVEVKPGLLCLAAREVSFRTNLDITGPVNLGHFISHGYGQLYKGASR